jgi:hypothetical protein
LTIFLNEIWLAQNTRPMRNFEIIVLSFHFSARPMKISIEPQDRTQNNGFCTNFRNENQRKFEMKAKIGIKRSMLKIHIGF